MSKSADDIVYGSRLAARRSRAAVSASTGNGRVGSTGSSVPPGGWPVFIACSAGVNAAQTSSTRTTRESRRLVSPGPSAKDVRPTTAPPAEKTGPPALPDGRIAAVLHQAEQGIPVGELCRQVGISEQSFYRWKKVYGGLQPSEARELKQLRDEVTKLKHLVADLSLDKVMLQDIVQKKF